LFLSKWVAVLWRWFFLGCVWLGGWGGGCCVLSGGFLVGGGWFAGVWGGGGGGGGGGRGGGGGGFFFRCCCFLFCWLVFSFFSWFFFVCECCFFFCVLFLLFFCCFFLLSWFCFFFFFLGVGGCLKHAAGPNRATLPPTPTTPTPHPHWFPVAAPKRVPRGRGGFGGRELGRWWIGEPGPRPWAEARTRQRKTGRIYWGTGGGGWGGGGWGTAFPGGGGLERTKPGDRCGPGEFVRLGTPGGMEGGEHEPESGLAKKGAGPSRCGGGGGGGGGGCAVALPGHTGGVSEVNGSEPPHPPTLGDHPGVVNAGGAGGKRNFGGPERGRRFLKTP